MSITQPYPVAGRALAGDDRLLKELNLQLSLTARERLRAEHEHPGPAATADHLVSPHAG